jgi:hypothetical protein
MLKNIYFASFIVVLSFLGCKKSDSNTPPPTTGFLSASATNLTLNGAILNSKDSFNILSNVNWTISISPASATWLTANITSGSGNSKILITTNQLNTTGVDRVAQVIIAATGNLAVPIVTIQINQTQANVTIWSKLYGGSLNDQFNDIIKTSDGGYVVAGYTLSNDGDIALNRGNSDFWMVKLNANGTIIWSKTMGGSGSDIGFSVVESSDGGYVFAGYTSSNDGDVTGYHGNIDFWVIKLDVNGNLIWNKVYGGSNYESPGFSNSIISTTNGDFIIVGNTQSNDGDVTGMHLNVFTSDAWVLRINSIGNIVWQKCLGGTENDGGRAIVSTANGGCVVAALTASSNGDVTNNYGSTDVWLMKLNDMGNIIWQKSFGGSAEDAPNSIINSSNGGYVLSGSTKSNNGNVTGNHGGYDVWVFKIDDNGVFNWQKCLGGSVDEGVGDLCITSSGGYMLTGQTFSNNGDVTGGYNKPDAWLVEIDGLGNKLWQRCVGGNPYLTNANNFDGGLGILALPNNEYLMQGNTASNDGDVSGQHGVVDGWLYKFRR